MFHFSVLFSSNPTGPPYVDRIPCSGTDAESDRQTQHSNIILNHYLIEFQIFCQFYTKNFSYYSWIVATCTALIRRSALALLPFIPPWNPCRIVLLFAKKPGRYQSRPGQKVDVYFLTRPKDEFHCEAISPDRRSDFTCSAGTNITEKARKSVPKHRKNAQKYTRIKMIKLFK